MLLTNGGSIAAVLHVAGIELPESFSVDPGRIDHFEQEARAKNPKLDNEAARLAGIAGAAAEVVLEIVSRQADAEKQRKAAQAAEKAAAPVVKPKEVKASK